MTTVKIYKINCTKGQMIDETGSGFSLDPWGSNTAYYEGDDDGGSDYDLPDGYTVADTKYGQTAIWDDNNKHCELITGRNGDPMLVSLTRTISLKKNGTKKNA